MTCDSATGLESRTRDCVPYMLVAGLGETRSLLSQLPPLASLVLCIFCVLCSPDTCLALFPSIHPFIFCLALLLKPLKTKQNHKSNQIPKNISFLSLHFIPLDFKMTYTTRSQTRRNMLANHVNNAGVAASVHNDDAVNHGDTTRNNIGATGEAHNHTGVVAAMVNRGAGCTNIKKRKRADETDQAGSEPAGKDADNHQPPPTNKRRIKPPLGGRHSSVAPTHRYALRSRNVAGTMNAAQVTNIISSMSGSAGLGHGHGTTQP